MPKCSINPELIQEAISFHGHSCPGLAIGIRASELALQKLKRSEDEEVVALVETDMCGVDAIQYLVGCTFGKGNLIFRDYGKNAFTFYNRNGEDSFRIVTDPEFMGNANAELGRLRKKKNEQGLSATEEKQLKDVMAGVINRIMEDDLDKIFQLKEVEGLAPHKAHMMGSLICEKCGEATMESKTRRFTGQTLCIPCFESVENRG